MSKQYSKKTIAETIKQKLNSKGFQIRVQKGEGKGIASTTPTLDDLVDAFAETMEEVLQKGNLDAELVAKEFKIGPAGQQLEVAYKASAGETNVIFDMTTDPKFFTWMETLHGLLQAPYPLAGYGGPNTFALALKSLISNKPTKLTGKISAGSKKVKITV